MVQNIYIVSSWKRIYRNASLNTLNAVLKFQPIYVWTKSENFLLKVQKFIAQIHKKLKCHFFFQLFLSTLWIQFWQHCQKVSYQNSNSPARNFFGIFRWNAIIVAKNSSFASNFSECFVDRYKAALTNWPKFFESKSKTFLLKVPKFIARNQKKNIHFIHFLCVSFPLNTLNAVLTYVWKIFGLRSDVFRLNIQKISFLYEFFVKQLLQRNTIDR